MSTTILYGILAIFLVLMGSILFAPLRFLLRLGVQVCGGLLGLLACSLCASLVGITISINAVTAAIITLLGPTGAVLLVLLSWSFSG